MARRFFLVTDQITRGNYRVNPQGGDLSAFKKNPVMLFMHERAHIPWNASKPTLPIGRWENIEQSEKGVSAEAVFDVDDPFAAQIAGKVERKFMNAVSAGFRVLDVEYIQDTVVITKWELIEGSIVDIGRDGASVEQCLYYETPEGMKPLANYDEIKQAFPIQTPPILNQEEMNPNPNEALHALTKAVETLTQKVGEMNTQTLAIDALAKKVDTLIEQSQKQNATPVANAPVANAPVVQTAPTEEKTTPLVTPPSIAEVIRQNAAPTNEPEKDFHWYRKNDANALAEIKATDPTRYMKMCEAVGIKASF